MRRNKDESGDTIVALATPPGVSGLAVIRLSGPDTFSVLTQLMPKVQLERQPSHTLRLTWLRDERKRPIDQVMVALFRKPHSYTGEDMAEITCHGAPIIVDKIIELCRKQNCRLAEPGEFTRRAVLAGKLTLSQAEAVLALVNAQSFGAHQGAISAYQGGVSRLIAPITNRLRELYAEAEFLLGFDEDGPMTADQRPNTRSLEEKTKALLTQLNRLIDRAERSRFLFEPARLAIIGRPNVGKSSLFNRLLQQERAIISGISGTTRDRIDAPLYLGNLTVQLTDTCGFHPRAKNPLTRLGNEETRRAIAEADILLVVFDGSEPFQEADRVLLLQVLKKPKIYIINKSDLPQRLRPKDIIINSKVIAGKNGAGSPVKPLSVSCKTGTNILRLRQKIKKVLSPNVFRLPAITRRQIEHLQECREALRTSLKTPDLDAKVTEIKFAIEALAKIDGGITNQELLNRIFSQFCVGK
ncbi:MAG: tRNA uridine-5-carboxymethylaminomethyl(34) synthesis GTPase MnmE [candidate division WOR-3 bacterium]